MQQGTTAVEANIDGVSHRTGLNAQFHTVSRSNASDSAIIGSFDQYAFTWSPTSSQGLLLLPSHNVSQMHPIKTPREQSRSYEVAQVPGQNTPLEHIYSWIADGSTLSPLIPYPSHALMRADQYFEYCLAPKMAIRRASHIRPLTLPDEIQVTQQCNSLLKQSLLHSPGQAHLRRELRTPMLHPSFGSHVTSIAGVPELLAVQELAFRQGQHDRGSSRNRIPSSPFPQQFDSEWAKSYKIGRLVGGTPVVRPILPSSASHSNHTWPILINPQTQDLEYPNGSFDASWIQKICEFALNCMHAMIRATCKRSGDWRKMVIDVPTPCQQALLGFPELLARYERLKRDAHEALNGGLPPGY